jgi:hypothetical protein
MTQLDQWLGFHRMCVPLILQVVFWICLAMIFVVGGVFLWRHQWAMGLGLLVVGPLVLRILIETLIVNFRKYEVLQEISASLERP